jgi:hypothetical protein
MMIAALVMLLVSLTSGASTYQAGSPAAPVVRNLSPAPGARLRTFFPTVSAVIEPHSGSRVNRAKLHLFFDGRDVSSAAELSRNTITFTPHQHVNAGWHDVFLEGKDAANRAFSQAWVFETDDPDIDVPVSDTASFGFLPIGIAPGEDGPFMHFFFVSPFDGAALLQLCGFATPLAQVPGTPVFFITTPLTLGTALLGCTPGIALTPFGFAQSEPVFFPLEIAGPNVFQPPGRRRIMSASGYAPESPVYRAPPAMPGVPPAGMPSIAVPRIGVPRVVMPRTGMPRAVMPPVSIPHPFIPRP